MGSQSLSHQYLKKHIEDSIYVKQSILEDSLLLSTLYDVSVLCVEAFRAGNKVILAGNGGSAADAQHIAAEFVSRFRFDRPGLPSLSLSTDTSMLTAIGNDYGYEKLFARQLQANGREGDVFIGISTSGTSKNVVEAMKVCPELGITSVGFTGQGGGLLVDLADHCLCVPSNSTAFIQESHIMLGHIICGFVEDSIFRK
ncbi:D-sedoheptulose 7-phosphate isomerase [Hydrogenovibrio thermophilus]|uniref:Phosphoheptose isomerase n=1 Tax=Hydrogenovibrio thermophilus TaxID=265883 RepID=A0A410H4P8_9GAMM|nr:D-sedoheptulose 7-phosphate isomerase [Hydrogenovibrio thermophilus]QAB15780.1 SIS domain-containing protein [Hydrogenovibrio thermophilus]